MSHAAVKYLAINGAANGEYFDDLDYTQAFVNAHLGTESNIYTRLPAAWSEDKRRGDLALLLRSLYGLKC